MKLFTRLIICFLFATLHQMEIVAQTNDLTKYCDNSLLLSTSKNENDKKEREENYFKLLGVLKELSAYRSQYLSDGSPANLFPTIYYHITSLEMDKIRLGNFNHPNEKMRQMLDFYDAYKFNRTQYDINKTCGEEHWGRHFKEVDNFGWVLGLGSSIDCVGLRKIINSAIRAHVKFDLARAIRHAFNERTDKTITPQQLLAEFLSTNEIFAAAQADALIDIKAHFISLCFIIDPSSDSWKFFGGISLDEVKQWRQEAFNNAIINPIQLEGYDGIPLIPQPSYSPHNSYLESGKKLCQKNSTLFLFDLSGSMNENGSNSNISKLQQAKNASQQTLNALKNNNSGATDEVAVLGFSGGCVPDPTTVISDFESDLSLVESRIDAMGAGGGTPLTEAIAASECKLANYLAQSGQNKGKLIILSDGEATCQPIRPPGTYSSGQLGQKIITISASQCGNSNYKIKYYTIGLNIVAGSPAERDLQYLSQISGGKYLNVQSQTQLERAFKKFNRTYIPKPNPSSGSLPSASISKFDGSVNQINAESFSAALSTCEEFSKLQPDDCNGAYNLALMQEANDFYKNAISNYQKYLSLCPNASDKEFVEKQIAFLEEEFKQFLLFQKEVVKSDLEYLKLHFEKIQNGQSIALAEEFKGFLKEKGDYYKNLPELMGKSSDRLFKKNCQEVASGLDNSAKTINRNPSAWDRDATPSLSMTYLNLERLLESF